MGAHGGVFSPDPDRLNLSEAGSGSVVVVAVAMAVTAVFFVLRFVFAVVWLKAALVVMPVVAARAGAV